MISKKTFVDTINKIIKYANMNDTITSIYRENDVEYFPGQYFEYEGMVVKILSDAMDDRNDWIGWWLYEGDYGRDVTPKSASYSEKEYIDLTTPEKLYDFLYNEYLNRNNYDSEENVN